MGKILKVIGQIAAVAVNFIPGIGQLASVAISVGLSVGTSLLAKKPSPTLRNATGNLDRLRATINPRAFRTSAIGPTALPVDVR